MQATVPVTELEWVGTDTIAVRLGSPDGFDAQPGQFVKLTGTIDGEEYARFYTISSPDVEETFELTIGVDREDPGSFSAHLANLAPGDEIEFSGPFGRDYYEGEERVVVLAGGPGIGPAVGIGERAIADDREVAIVYQDEDPAHRDRLDVLADAGATVVVTDGSIDAAVADVVSGVPEEQLFVYGFADFIDLAVDAIEAAGGDAGKAKIENFG